VALLLRSGDSDDIARGFDAICRYVMPLFVEKLVVDEAECIIDAVLDRVIEAWLSHYPASGDLGTWVYLQVKTELSRRSGDNRQSARGM
jgi:hypothetical protein